MKFPFTRKLADPQAQAPAPQPEQQKSPVDLAAEFRCLWTVSQFFSVLQRLQLQPERGRVVDLSELGQKLEEARQNKKLPYSRLAQLQKDIGVARTEIYELENVGTPVGAP